MKMKIDLKSILEKIDEKAVILFWFCTLHSYMYQLAKTKMALFCRNWFISVFIY